MTTRKRTALAAVTAVGLLFVTPLLVFVLHAVAADKAKSAELVRRQQASRQSQPAQLVQRVQEAPSIQAAPQPLDPRILPEEIIPTGPRPASPGMVIIHPPRTIKDAPKQSDVPAVEKLPPAEDSAQLKLPSVSFLAPTAQPTTPRNDEEPSVESKALLKNCLRDLRSFKAAERIKAAEALGELGFKAKSARRALCAAMLDASPAARAAAADALKKVDAEIAELAVRICVNQSVEAVYKAGLLREEGEPLTPLILTLARQLSIGMRTGADGRYVESPPLSICITSLTAIAAADAMVCKFVVTMINYNGNASNQEAVRHAALVGIRDMKNAKTALLALLAAAQTDTEGNRLEAIHSLQNIYDENNDRAILKVLTSMRFDKNAAVRRAVNQALDKLEKKLN